MRLVNSIHGRTKGSLSNTLLAISAVMLIGICLYIGWRGTAKSENASIQAANVASSGAVIKNYTVNYPVFHLEKIDMQLRNYASHQLEAFFNALGNSKRNDPTSNLTLDYTIRHYGSQTLTVAFHQEETLFGGQSQASEKTFTFDVKTQTQLQLAALFKSQPDAEKLLGRILHDYFAHQKTEQFTAAELDRFSKLTLSDVQDFMLDDDQLLLSLDIHPLASTPTVKTIGINKELLTLILADNYVRADKSVISGVIDQPAYSIDVMPKHDVVINPSGKLLALTFDDGPGMYTAHLLDVLKQYDAHATFFMIGRQVAGYAGVVRRVVDEGNEIGNHTWDHKDLTTLSYRGIDQEIQSTQTAISQVTGGYVPTLQRPPYEAFNGAVSAYLRSHGLSMALWTVDTQDWLHQDVNYVYQVVMSSAADGKVILLHDIHPTSVEAAERAIPALEAEGYQLVTFSQLKQYR